MKVLKSVLIILCIIIVVLTISVSIANRKFKQKVNNEIKELFENSNENSPEIITEEDIESLPEPVQKHLKYSQLIGKEKIRTVRLKQKGFIRTKPDANWMPFEAEQYYTTDPPAFIWFANAKVLPLLFLNARDKFSGGRGNMLIKLLSLFKVADARGPEMDQGTLLRYLNEIMWFPTAYLNNYIRWEPVDHHSAKATMSYGGVTASALLSFNEQCELINFTAERFMANNGQFSKETWSTPIEEYKEINGIRIPVKGTGVWNLKSGDFEYIRLEVTGIEYNIPLQY